MMKKRNIIFIFSLCILCFTSCKDSGSPKAITKLFLISLNKNDLATARSISTSNTHDILRIWDKLSNGKFTQEEINNRSANFKVTIDKVLRHNDSLVTVSYHTTPQILPFNQINLQKQYDRDGRARWKVDISTIDIATSVEGINVDTTNNDGQYHPLPDSIAAKE